jgi:hypothetical protein
MFTVTLWFRSIKSDNLRDKWIANLQSGNLKVYFWILKDRYNKPFCHWNMAENTDQSERIIHSEFEEQEIVEFTTVKSYEMNFNDIIKENNIKKDDSLIVNFVLFMERLSATHLKDHGEFI